MIKRNVINRVLKVTQVNKKNPVVIWSGKDNQLALKAEEWEIRSNSLAQAQGTDVYHYAFQTFVDRMSQSNTNFKGAAPTITFSDGLMTMMNKSEETEDFILGPSSESLSLFDISGKSTLIYHSESGVSELLLKNIEQVGDDVLKENIKISFDITKSFYSFSKGNLRISSSNGFTGQEVSLPSSDDIEGLDLNYEAAFQVSVDENRIITNVLKGIKNSPLKIYYNESGYLIVEVVNEAKSENLTVVIKTAKVDVPEAALLDGEMTPTNQLFISNEDANNYLDTTATRFFDSTDARQFKSVYMNGGIAYKFKPSKVVKDNGESKEEREVYGKYEAQTLEHQPYVLPLYWMRSMINITPEGDDVFILVFETHNKVVMSSQDKELKVWFRK